MFMKFLYSTIVEDDTIETVVEVDGERQIIKGEKLEPETLRVIKENLKGKGPFSMGYNADSAICNVCGQEEEHECNSERKNMNSNTLYAKIMVGDLEGRILKVTGSTDDMVTVEYVEECFSYKKNEVLPVIKGEEMTWDQYSTLMEKNNG